MLGTKVFRLCSKQVKDAPKRAYFREQIISKTKGDQGHQMDTSSASTFRHRHNPDGSWDSICMKCYLTVATTATEDDLEKSEQSHDCAELLAIKTGHEAVT